MNTRTRENSPSARRDATRGGHLTSLHGDEGGGGWGTILALASDSFAEETIPSLYTVSHDNTQKLKRLVIIFNGGSN